MCALVLSWSSFWISMTSVALPLFCFLHSYLVKNAFILHALKREKQKKQYLQKRNQERLTWVIPLFHLHLRIDRAIKANKERPMHNTRLDWPRLPGEGAEYALSISKELECSSESCFARWPFHWTSMVVTGSSSLSADPLMSLPPILAGLTDTVHDRCWWTFPRLTFWRTCA